MSLHNNPEGYCRSELVREKLVSESIPSRIVTDNLHNPVAKRSLRLDEYRVEREPSMVRHTTDHSVMRGVQWR